MQTLTSINANSVLSIMENCAGEVPIVSWDKDVCEFDPVSVEITSVGTKFRWFGSSTNEYPLTESGKSVVLDTLKTSVVLFVANADSSFLSRKIPVRINVYKKPDFTILQDSVDNTSYFYSPSSHEGINLYSWSIDGVVESDEENMEFSYDDSGTYTVCLHASNQGCETEVCQDFELIVTGLEQETEKDFELYPNPASWNVFTFPLVPAEGWPMIVARS